MVSEDLRNHLKCLKGPKKKTFNIANTDKRGKQSAKKNI